MSCCGVASGFGNVCHTCRTPVSYSIWRLFASAPFTCNHKLNTRTEKDHKPGTGRMTVAAFVLDHVSKEAENDKKGKVKLTTPTPAAHTVYESTGEAMEALVVVIFGSELRGHLSYGMNSLSEPMV